MGFFKSGYSAVKKEQKKAERRQKEMSGKLFDFFITEANPEAKMVFLNEEPIVFKAHQLQVFRGNGRKGYETKVCVAEREDCPICAEGDKPSTKGAFIVIDRTPYESKDKNGKKHVNKDGRIRLYTPGLRVLGVLTKKHERGGLVGYEWEVTRIGSGTATTYDFERGDRVKITAKEIEQLLPEVLRKEFTPDSDDEEDISDAMMALLENQLERMIPDSGEDEEFDDSDDDEDEELEDDEDDDDVPPPRPKVKRSASPTKKKSSLRKKK